MYSKSIAVSTIDILSIKDKKNIWSYSGKLFIKNHCPPIFTYLAFDIQIIGKTLLDDVNKHLKTKSLLTTPRNVLPLNLKQTFPPIIWFSTEGEGDGIESRLPFKIFSTLTF